MYSYNLYYNPSITGLMPSGLGIKISPFTLVSQLKDAIWRSVYGDSVVINVSGPLALTQLDIDIPNHIKFISLKVYDTYIVKYASGILPILPMIKTLPSRTEALNISLEGFGFDIEDDGSEFSVIHINSRSCNATVSFLNCVFNSPGVTRVVKPVSGPISSPVNTTNKNIAVKYYGCNFMVRGVLDFKPTHFSISGTTKFDVRVSDSILYDIRELTTDSDYDLLIRNNEIAYPVINAQSQLTVDGQSVMGVNGNSQTPSTQLTTLNFNAMVNNDFGSLFYRMHEVKTNLSFDYMLYSPTGLCGTKRLTPGAMIFSGLSIYVDLGHSATINGVGTKDYPYNINQLQALDMSSMIGAVINFKGKLYINAGLSESLSFLENKTMNYVTLRAWDKGALGQWFIVLNEFYAPTFSLLKGCLVNNVYVEDIALINLHNNDIIITPVDTCTGPGVTFITPLFFCNAHDDLGVIPIGDIDITSIVAKPTYKGGTIKCNTIKYTEGYGVRFDDTIIDAVDVVITPSGD